jgi:hypothetical protein
VNAAVATFLLIFHFTPLRSNFDIFSSPSFAEKGAGFWGASVRTHARTPKSGYLPGKFLEEPYFLRNFFSTACVSTAIIVNALEVHDEIFNSNYSYRIGCHCPGAYRLSARHDADLAPGALEPKPYA